MSLGFAGILEQLIGPPGGMILLILSGVLLLQKNQHVAKALIIAGLTILYLVSIPLISNIFLRIMETPVSMTKDDLINPKAQAIVVLGGGRREDVPEYSLVHDQGDTIKYYTLERIRYAAWLSKQTKLPILVSGGLADEDGLAEAIMMKNVLQQEFGCDVKWVEPDSRNTYENAQFSAVKLKESGVDKIYLVTHALHMSRAQWAFEQQGLLVLPSPTAYRGEKDMKMALSSFLPSAQAIKSNALIFHEAVGNIWYRLRY